MSFDFRIRTIGACWFDIKSSEELSFEGDELQKEAIYCNVIAGVTLFDDFVKCVVREFSVYSSGDKRDFYENEWKEFPFAEFTKLSGKVLR